jgi:hypothetical protein
VQCLGLGVGLGLGLGLRLGQGLGQGPRKVGGDRGGGLHLLIVKVQVVAKNVPDHGATDRGETLEQQKLESSVVSQGQIACAAAGGG